MKKLILQISIILILSAIIFAQENLQKPKMLVEFGATNTETLSAYSFVLAQELNKNPKKKAVVRISGGAENYFAQPFYQGSYIDAFLKNNYKISSEKYLIEYCNVNKEKLRIQLFTLPENENLPKCDEDLTIPEKTVLFQGVSFYDDTEFSSQEALENSFISVISSNQGYSRISQKVLKRLLKDSPESKIYIIAYLGTTLEEVYEEENSDSVKKIRKSDKKSLAKKMLLSAKNELTKDGIKSSQIELVEGRYINNKRELEFWFVPKAGEIPKPKPDYFPKKNRNQK